MFKEVDTRVKETFQYAKAKMEVVVYKAAELIEIPRVRKIAKSVAIAHLSVVFVAALIEAWFPVYTQSVYVDLAAMMGGVITTIAGPSNAGTKTFTPNHLYFMSSSGCSDANNGTSTATPWCSPRHSTVAGDIILAKSGTYSSNIFNSTTGNGFGVVGGSIPSIINGIDGTGGIYFAVVLCAGASVGDCKVADNTNFAAVLVDQNNWAIQGFQVTTNTTSGTQQVGFLADGRIGNASGSNITHHICFINDITTDVGMGYATADGGTNNGVSPGNGVDQFCVVGSIGHDSNSWTQCIGAFDDAGPANFDSTPGTHVFFGGNFGINNQQKYGCLVADGEIFFFDTPDAHGYTGQMIMQDNLGFKAERAGLDVFFQHSVTTAVLATIRQVNNTIYGVMNETNWTHGTTGNKGQILLGNSVNTTNWPFPTTIQNNISLSSAAVSAAGTGIYALQESVLHPNGNINVGGTGNENIISGLQSACGLAFCNPTFDAASDSSVASLGTNFYEDPLFKNVSDAMTNHIGTPNCSGFETTVACMGWNWAAQTVSALSVIDDFTATSVHSAGKGYLPPQKACLTSGERFNNYPTYLKGIVYLHAVSGWTNGTVIQQKAGLVNIPCNM